MSSDKGRFHLASIQRADGVIIRACGEFIVGHGAAEPLWTPYVELARRGAVMLDLAGVTDIDARGLGVLAWLVRRSADRGVAPSVVAASHVVATLAGLARLDRVLQGAWDNRFGTAPDCFARRARAVSSMALKPVRQVEDGTPCFNRSPVRPVSRPRLPRHGVPPHPPGYGSEVDDGADHAVV